MRAHHCYECVSRARGPVRAASVVQLLQFSSLIRTRASSGMLVRPFLIPRTLVTPPQTNAQLRGQGKKQEERTRETRLATSSRSRATPLPSESSLLSSRQHPIVYQGMCAQHVHTEALRAVEH